VPTTAIEADITAFVSLLMWWVGRKRAKMVAGMALANRISHTIRPIWRELIMVATFPLGEVISGHGGLTTSKSVTRRRVPLSDSLRPRISAATHP
jgi:hypothetical protein